MRSLLDRTLKAELGKTNGLSELVTYKRYSTGETILDLQSFCQSNKQDTESSKREYEVTFHALYLDFRPSGGDTIEWDGIIYMISGDEDIHKVLEGCYDITGRQKKHTTGRRR